MSDRKAMVFQPETHTYKVNGIILPSVTQILGRAGLIDEHGSNEALERGSRIHLACRYHDENDLEESEFTEEELGNLAGWKKFLQELSFGICEIEQPRFSQTHGFAGTPDRIIKIATGPAIVDIKTGVYAAWHRLQLAAYAALCPEVYQRVAVYLNFDGTYKIREFPPHERLNDFNVFLSAINLHRWKETAI